MSHIRFQLAETPSDASGPDHVRVIRDGVASYLPPRPIDAVGNSQKSGISRGCG
jgi:hypothetical protein